MNIVHACMCVYHVNFCYHRDQKRASDPLELELFKLCAPCMWVLGPKPQSSATAVSALNL